MKRKTTVYITLGGSQNMRALQRLAIFYAHQTRVIAEPVTRLL